jgi:hypothetical protein
LFGGLIMLDKKDIDFLESIYSGEDEKLKNDFVKFATKIYKTPTGKQSLEAVAKSGYKVNFLEGIDGAGHVNHGKKELNLNHEIDDLSIALTIAHEGRHILQAQNQGGDLNCKTLNAKSYLVNTRIHEADAYATETQLCWELKKQGDNKSWEQYKKTWSDRTMHYEKFAKSGEAGERKARELCFLEYYRDDYRKMYDFNEAQVLCYKARGEDCKMVELSAKKMVKDICNDENGKSYFSLNPEILEKGYMMGVDKNARQVLDLSNKVVGSNLPNDASMEKIPDLASFWRNEVSKHMGTAKKNHAFVANVITKSR